MKKMLFHNFIWKSIKKRKYLKLGLLLFFIFGTTLTYGQDGTDSISSANIKDGMVSFNQRRQEIKKLGDSLLLVVNSHIKKGDFKNAKQTVQRALKVYESLNETKSIGNCFSKIATIFYYQGNYPEALNYFERSISVYKSIDFKQGLSSSSNNMGAIYYYLGNYPKALDYYQQALMLDELLNDEKQAAMTIQNIGSIYLELNDFENAMKHFQTAKRSYEISADNKTLSQVLNAIGEIYLKQEEYIDAKTHFEKALKLAIVVEDKQRILESVFNLGELYGLENDYKNSLRHYNQCLELAKEINNERFKSLSLTAIGFVENKFGNKLSAIANCKRGLAIATTLNTVSVQEKACKCLYQAYRYLNKKGIALIYFERAIKLKDSLQARRTANNLQQMEFQNQMLKDSIVQAEKERKLQMLHEQEVAKKEHQRNILIITGCFILVFAGGLWSRLTYTKKAKGRLQIEKDRSEHLLLNILPEEIAEELKEKGYVDAQDFEIASILFTDFKSFTETASKLTPQELVEEINTCFKAFDGIMETYGIEKIKTIGDSYMAAGGLPKPDAKAVKNTILAALAMQEFISKRKSKNTIQNKPAFEMRVGIHVGPIVAGIVGVKKFQYDIWGDTVNTASRMESSGAVGKVNISSATYELVKEESDLNFEYRGKITTKGKGDLEMFFALKSSNQKILSTF